MVAAKKTRKPSKKQMAIQKAKRLKKIKITLLTLLVLMVCILAIVWNALFRPLPLPKGGLLVEVKDGDSYNRIFADMQNNHQVRFLPIVKAYQRFVNRKPLQTGMYFIPQGSNARFALLKFQSGMSDKVTVRLIEGWTVKKFRNYLYERPGIRLASDQLTPEQIAEKLNLPTPSPEGWFNPNTYFFPAGANDLAIMRRLTQEQSQILEAEWQNKQANLPIKTPYEALILASIIEKETSVDKERALVASVFVNRLKQNMRLQTDPTVIYGLGDSYNGDLKKIHLQTYTPYNTYKINGLPPTPISNPSKASIHAALHPAASEALYFVATGTGGHKFSKTLEEHNAAVQQYLAVIRGETQSESKEGLKAPEIKDANTKSSMVPARAPNKLPIKAVDDPFVSSEPTDHKSQNEMP